MNHDDTDPGTDRPDDPAGSAEQPTAPIPLGPMPGDTAQQPVVPDAGAPVPPPGTPGWGAPGPHAPTPPPYPGGQPYPGGAVPGGQPYPGQPGAATPPGPGQPTPPQGAGPVPPGAPGTDPGWGNPYRYGQGPSLPPPPFAAQGAGAPQPENPYAGRAEASQAWTGDPSSYPGYAGYGWHYGQGAPFAAAPPPKRKGKLRATMASKRAQKVAASVGVVVLALAAGVAIGHDGWTDSASNSAVGSTGNGNSSSPFGNGSGSGGFGNGGSSSSSGGSGPSDVAAIAAKVAPGLVDINTTLGYQQDQAAGTGMVLTSDGEILTNNHVIEGATTISVTDIGNGKTYNASVVGYNRTADVAVLQLANASGLKTVTTSDSSKVSVGQGIVGVGNAGGTGGTPSAAGGTVTALNQSITASDASDGTQEQLSGLIQTNANIQPGDSGGSLVNTDGQVIGMNTAASQGYTFQSQASPGVQAFAIPINSALSIAKAIESGNASSTTHIGATGFLGVEVSVSGGSGSNGFGFGFGNGSGSSGNSSTQGANVAQVVTGSPAQEAGLASGDVITSVNGQQVTTPTSLTNLIEPKHPGDKVTIGWTDTSGQTHTATVTLSSGPPQ